MGYPTGRAEEGSMMDPRDVRDDEPERTEEAERRELEAAGWDPRGKGAKTIWRSPADGGWYAHYQAVKMQKEKGP
jgi:hypothetical protein